MPQVPGGNEVNFNARATKLTIAATAAFCLLGVVFVAGRGSVHQSSEWQLKDDGSCRNAQGSVVCELAGTNTYMLNLTGNDLVVWWTEGDDYQGEVFRVDATQDPADLPPCFLCADPYSPY